MTPQPYSATGERLTLLFDHPWPHGPVQAVRVDYAPGATPRARTATPPAPTCTSFPAQYGSDSTMRRR